MTAMPAYMYGPADEAAAILERQRQREEAFYLRLENWRRWAKRRSWTSADMQARARSLETRYRSPIWYTEDVNFQRWVTEEKAAWEVEQAWYSLPASPVDYRACVKYSVIWGEPYKATCRRLGIHWKQYDQVLGRGLDMLRNRLR